MINSYPFYPQNYYKPRTSYPQNSYNKGNNAYSNMYNSSIKSSQHPYGFPKYPSKANSYQQSNSHVASKSNEQQKVNSSNDDKPMFEILGIKLFQDDILLICLIFFLYNEGIKDEFLFFALVLLLLS